MDLEESRPIWLRPRCRTGGITQMYEPLWSMSTVYRGSHTLRNQAKEVARKDVKEDEFIHLCNSTCATPWSQPDGTRPRRTTDRLPR